MSALNCLLPCWPLLPCNYQPYDHEPSPTSSLQKSSQVIQAVVLHNHLVSWQASEPLSEWERERASGRAGDLRGHDMLLCAQQVPTNGQQLSNTPFFCLYFH